MERNKLSLKRPRKSPENKVKKMKMLDQIEKSDKTESIELNGNGERSIMEPSDSKSEEKFVCDICKKELTHMNLQRRMQHMNRCADEQIEANKIPPIVYQCPFCRKDILQNTKANHLKLCGRSNGITDPEKLIQVNQLIEKQAEERRALRLPTAAIEKPKAVNKTKRIGKWDPDMQLALAISLSLKEENDRKDEAELVELGIPVPTWTKNSIQERRRKKKQRDGEFLPILMTITPKEREEKMQIKIAQVLDGEKKMPMLNINDIMGLKSNIESNRKSIKSPVMWRKASCPDPELDGDFFTFVASKRKTLSEIPGRDATQIPMKNEVQEAEKCLSKEFRHPGFFPKQFSYAQINNIDDLITDFGSMVGNPELSDVTIRTRDECVIPAHRFIFFARCVELYEETEKTPILDWPMVSAEAANLFLFFLYNAQLVSKNENVLKEVQILAERYNVHKLLDRLPKSFEMSAENRLILSPECMSPELLPMSEYENNLSDNDDDCCESPIIYSQFSQKCDGKTEFKSHLPIKLGTSTPKSNVDNTRKPRTSSISTITSDGDNEIESSLTRAVFSNTINEIQRENSDVEPRPLVSSPVIGCFSQKYDSIHCLEEDSFTRFNNSRMNDSQPESLHNLESVPDENIFCKSPIINSKFSMEGDNREDFQSPIKNETSTPISKLVNIRLPRISRLSTINTSDGNNEIESAFTSPIISGSNSKMDDSVIDLEDAPGVIASSPVIASVSQKFIVDANESSVRFQWLREDYSENNITVFDGVPKHNSSRTCYSQSEALHKREREPEGNDTWKDFDDINHNFSLSRSPPKPPDESLSPPYNPLLSDTPILPLAERIKKFRNPEKPISDTQNESSDCRQVTTSKARPVTPKKAISNTHTKPVDCHQATPKKTISETNTRTKKVIRRRKQISSSQPVTSNITPKPNFIDMNTPDIKNQLKKYGIRQLPNKKAIKMLEHIYEGTHPMVTDSEHENSAIDISIKMADNANEDNLSGSQSDHLNESLEMPEETCFIEELPSPPTEDISEAFKKFIKAKPDIYKKILLYEPIKLEELHSEIKNDGLKINMATLKELLDKQCITFTVQRDRPRQPRRKRKNL